MRTSVAIAFFAAILAAISCENLAVATNLVVNGGFETGPPMFDGWTVIDGGTGGLILDPFFPHSGTYAAEFSATHGTHDSLEQLLPTTPGMTYEVSFWLANSWGDPQDNDFSASWDGIPLVSLFNVPTSPYTQYTLSVQATGIQSALRFTGRDQPAGLDLDDVSVVAIPEPSCGSLFALGAVSLWAVIRWRRSPVTYCAEL
jgi:hypothetical protein